MDSKVEYIADENVDPGMDQELRNLLSTCFTKPKDYVFKTQRYFIEPYPNRWIVRGENGKVVAHIGVHEREIHAEGKVYRFGGIAEVCVHPDARGMGLVKKMLVVIHEWLSARNFAFSILMGDPRVYSSSGYVEVDNIVSGGGEAGWKPFEGMVKELSETPWPSGEVRLQGANF
jgi:predicted N-acetyltransferase YhbS